MSDTKVFVEVKWNGGPRGEYHGDLGLDGSLVGITFDANNPGTQAVWHSRTKNFNNNMIPLIRAAPDHAAQHRPPGETSALLAEAINARRFTLAGRSPHPHGNGPAN